MANRKFTIWDYAKIDTFQRFILISSFSYNLIDYIEDYLTEEYDILNIYSTHNLSSKLRINEEVVGQYILYLDTMLTIEEVYEILDKAEIDDKDRLWIEAIPILVYKSN